MLYLQFNLNTITYATVMLQRMKGQGNQGMHSHYFTILTLFTSVTNVIQYNLIYSL